MRHAGLGLIAALGIMALSSPAPAVTVLGIHDTGVDASGAALSGGNGTVDPNYVILGGDVPAGLIGQQAKTYNEFGYFQPDTATARAINWSGDDTAEEGGTVVFRTTFDLTGYVPATAVLSGTVQADDSATIELNGHLLTTPAIGYYDPTAFTDSSFFVAGINDLDFLVQNNTGHTALRVANLSLSADAVVDAVPEPGSWVLLAAGFGLVGASRRRPAPPVVAA